MAKSYTSLKGSITTITPISIGAGQEAVKSPYTDYVVSEDNKKVHYIDHEKFEEELLKRDLIGEFTNAIVQMDNNRSNLDLKRFIQNRLQIPIDQLASHTYDSRGLTKNDRILITEVIKSAGRLYIPGSTLKGALKNAIMYDWLTKDKNTGGKKHLQRWIEDIQTCYKNSQSIIEEIEGLTLAHKKQRLGRDKYSQLKYLQRKLNQQIQKHISIDNSGLFGTIRDRKRRTALESHLIRVGDTQPVESTKSTLSIYFTQRLNLGTGSLTVPQVKEGIKPQVSFPFQWEIIKSFTHSYLRYWNNYAQEEILRVLNNFSIASIKYEFDQCAELIEKNQTKELHSFKEQYQKIITISNRVDTKEAILRIGSGKTYYDNSYGLALYKENPEIHTLFRKIFMLEPLQDIYPITRTVSVINQQVKEPLGWISIIFQ